MSKCSVCPQMLAVPQILAFAQNGRRRSLYVIKPVFTPADALIIVAATAGLFLVKPISKTN